MNTSDHHTTKSIYRWIKSIGLLTLLFFLASPAFGQNTKGDRPLKNQRQVRETKGKSVKRKERGSTKDIAGRRLRTKGQSSANRANASYPKPSTYSKSPRQVSDRAASPRGRVFSKSPRESKVRGWRGDVSGYPMKRMKPTGSDAARNNVYPQKGPYVRYARKQPKERPPVYSRTIKGNKFVTHRPRSQERAWTGGLDKGPIRNQSATGSVPNTYSQRGRYVAYYKKRSDRKQKHFSNKAELSQIKRLSKPPKTGGSQPRFYPSSASRSYAQRGRRNVYWGKVQKKEGAVTTDITGGPLRTRNYRSPTAGLVGRDTLLFFGRKPIGDRATRIPTGGYPTATKGARGWKGDVAGWPVRSPRAQRLRSHKPLTPTRPGIGADLISKIFNKNFKGVKPADRVPDTRASRFQGNIPNYGATKNFGDQGTGYPGNIKRGSLGGFSKLGRRYSGNIKRGSTGGFSRDGAGYSGNINRNFLPGYSSDIVGYSGRVKRSSLGEFSPSGFGYSGFMKRNQMRGFSEQGANYSGNLKGGKGFATEYVGYSGRIRRSQVRGFSGDEANYSGNLKGGKVFSTEYAGYSGNLKGGKGFTGEYVGYSGTFKRDRAKKGGGSLSGVLWNNRNKSVSRSSLTPLAAATGRYAGDIEYVGAIKQFGENGVRYSGFLKRGETLAGFTREGAGFSGRTKFKKPDKGGGSVSGILWNNDQTALAKNIPIGAGAINYSGRKKFERPDKGGGSVSGILWNNNQTALAKNIPAGAAAIGYSGRKKYKKPDKGGGSVSGILWNNDQTALAKNMPAGATAVDYSGRKKFKKPAKGGGSVSGILWNNNQTALSKHPPATAGAAAGLQVKVKELDYARKPKASKFALLGIAPTRSTVKASEYSRNMKQYWDYKHNPNSSVGALKAIAPGKAEARIRDFQGNVKMHKYSGSRLHPDAKFAHLEEDNVKQERGFLTNVKLLWSKMFKKSDNQPASVKDKGKKLHYDKREKGLWTY